MRPLRLGVSGFPETTVTLSSRAASWRNAARPVDIGLAAQDVQPVIEGRAEQGRHFGDELVVLGSFCHAL